MNEKQTEIVRQILEERERQDRLWGTNFEGRADEKWLAILTEEVGEVARALLEGDSDAHIIDELVQVGAVAVSWLEHRTKRAEQVACEADHLVI